MYSDRITLIKHLFLQRKSLIFVHFLKKIYRKYSVYSMYFCLFIPISVWKRPQTNNKTVKVIKKVIQRFLRLLNLIIL